jgi:hypothetical protein
MGVSIADYQEGFLGQEEGQLELQKAMQAGQITGRETADLALSYEPLKAESLEHSLKLLEFRTQDIKLWNAVPKMTAFNTVEEFLQLSSYGSERGGFYNEGELSDVEDSTYIRRAEHVKYMQVTGEVTMQAQMTKNYVDTLRKETENKMQWILRLANRSLTTADADIIPQQFNSYYKQHASIGVGEGFLYADVDHYLNSETIIDMRGKSLKQADVEKGAVMVDGNYGTANTLFAPTTIISALSQDYYQDQRIIQDSTKGYSGVIGTVPKAIATTLGDIALMTDKFMKAALPKTNASPADNVKAPATPTADGTTPNALVADIKAKFTGGEAGNVYYAVAAVNRYGESALAVLGSAVALAAAYSVDLKFAAGTGANSASGYQIYRTKVTSAGSAAGLNFYPIFKVSVAQLTAGYAGAAAGLIRDRGYFMPDTEQAFSTQLDDEVMSFKQLAPMSKLDLAVIAMARRFIVFMFGTPQLYAPKKMVRYINVGKTLTA